jgi:hypothetical protein
LFVNQSAERPGRVLGEMPGTKAICHLSSLVSGLSFGKSVQVADVFMVKEHDWSKRFEI